MPVDIRAAVGSGWHAMELVSGTGRFVEGGTAAEALALGAYHSLPAQTPVEVWPEWESVWVWVPSGTGVLAISPSRDYRGR